MTNIFSVKKELYHLFTEVENEGLQVLKQLEQYYLELKIQNEQWMNNFCSEDLSHQELFNVAYGDVLIGGLGFGGDILLIKDNPSVDSIHVIENNRDVIDLSWTRIAQDNPNITLYELDFITFLQTTSLTFDTIWIDIFREPGFAIPDEIGSLIQIASPKLKLGGEILIWKDPNILT